MNDFTITFLSFFGAPFLCKCLRPWLSTLLDLDGDFPTPLAINREPNIPHASKPTYGSTNTR
uniref:Uncharacterized protein n=1 Tax=Romanomermis culicivorax TaxID=13658 RepID=A0A915IX68_ROMCU